MWRSPSMRQRHRIMSRSRGSHNPIDYVADDGAQRVTILDNPDTGQPWFTESDAVRYLFGESLKNYARTGWLLRDGDRWKLAGPDAGPRGYKPEHQARELQKGRSIGTAATTRNAYNDHVKDDPEMARLVLRHLVPRAGPPTAPTTPGARATSGRSLRSRTWRIPSAASNSCARSWTALDSSNE